MLLLKRGGGNIKKNIGVIFLAVALCVVFSKAMFSSYKTSESASARSVRRNFVGAHIENDESGALKEMNVSPVLFNPASA